MLGLHRLHAGEIALPSSLSSGAWEIARLWVDEGRGKTAVTVGVPDRWDPELLGRMLIECVHTAAAGYAGAGIMSEADALERMWKGIDAERLNLDSQASSEELH